MHKYIFRRLLMMIPVLLGVTFIVYFILSMTPGDPASIILGDGATESSIEAMREQLGLNQPIFIRYFKFLFNALKGDLGFSYRNHLAVLPMVLERFPATMILALASIALALAVGIPVGIISAKKQYSAMDYSATLLTMLGVSMPTFWLGLILVMIFSLNLGWLPSQGMGKGFVPLIKSLILPAFTLCTHNAATIARMTRSSMLDVINQDYIATARSKGIMEAQVTTRHMLRNALIPIVTSVGLQFGVLLGGAMLTETVFSWPGLGRLMVESIKSKDIPIVLGCVIFMAVTFSLVNLLVDIVYAFVDPRIKSQFQKVQIRKVSKVNQ